MTMRVCVIGNSHVASLKDGWDQLASRYQDVELTFFAARGDLIARLNRVGNALEAPGRRLKADLAHTSGGRERIEFEAYDVFLTYGLAPRVPQLARSLSQAVRLQCCRDVWTRSTGLKVSELLRAGAKKPVFAGHAPQIAGARAGQTRNDQLSYAEASACMATELARDGIMLLRQPDETLADSWFSRLDLSRGSKRLDVGDEMSNQPHPDDDVSHMNGAFGAIYLQRFFALLDAS